MAKNLFAVGSYKLPSDVADAYLKDNIVWNKFEKAIFNSGYLVLYAKNIDLNLKTAFAWQQIQEVCEAAQISWLSIEIGEDHDDIDMQSFDAVIDNIEDCNLHEIFGIETVIRHNFN